jgi:cob(I)alamin adenosyltransferase
MSGLIHLYCGDGKGKTTCAMGLALRAAGRDIPVVVAQFLKSEDSGERLALRKLPGVTLLLLPQQVTFTFRMTEEEKKEAKAQSAARLREAKGLAWELGKHGPCLLILDEICAAVSTGMIEEEEVEQLLDTRPQGLEVVLTGRNPAPGLVQRADYVTEMQMNKHPYQQGIAARRGIEY